MKTESPVNWLTEWSLAVVNPHRVNQLMK